MVDAKDITMTAKEGLEIATTYYDLFSLEDFDEVVRRVNNLSLEIVARDIIIVREVINNFINIHTALQLHLAEHGYAVNVVEPKPIIIGVTNGEPDAPSVG